MATVATRLSAVNAQLDKLIDTGTRRYKVGLTEVEKILVSDLQNERKYLLGLKYQYGLQYDEDVDDVGYAEPNNVSFL